MDLWVVAAATGAGYLAKHLHKSAEEKEELSESTSQIRDQTRPSCRSSRNNRPKFGDIFLNKNEDVTNANYEISDILTLTKSQTSVDQINENTNVWDNGELGNNQFTRNRSLRSKRANGLSIKEKNVKKGYIFSPPPSPATPFAAPLIVNRVVNRDTSDLFGEFVDGDDTFSLEAKNELLGSRLSRQNGLFELPRTWKYHGLPNGIILFFAGITIGIISSIIENERELDNMNTLLKQKENLVRDLHEEIEIRDRLTVKEISIEDKQSSNWELDFSSSKHDLEKSTVDNPEVMSKIEAELEAELEKLELKIASAELEVEKISDFVELDPSFELDVVQGDLKIHVAQPANTNQTESDNNASGTSITHTHSSNYVVSPWELTLRLHELIESRLETRIEELELALKISKNKQSMSRRGSENSEFGFSETQIYMYEVDDMDPPLDMS